MRSLNVGCGSDVWGDVRLDVAKANLRGLFTLTVLADAHNLPFRDKCFEVTKASHILEHLMNPFKALDEIIRVTRDKIILRFPTERDVLPYFLCNIFPPNFTALINVIKNRKLHLWTINPDIICGYLKGKGWRCHRQTKINCFLAFLESGRKAKYFKWLTKRFLRIPCEYTIVAFEVTTIQHGKMFDK